eukprot:GHVH01006938.1.p1 GENE.GHVH01006938.1~~GHVH01006938.1.p1  ORF type:complete len:750 (-),score=88.01 GHVH01006938.1:142-2082(-)
MIAASDETALSLSLDIVPKSDFQGSSVNSSMEDKVHSSLDSEEDPPDITSSMEDNDSKLSHRDSSRDSTLMTPKSSHRLSRSSLDVMEVAADNREDSKRPDPLLPLKLFPTLSSTNLLRLKWIFDSEACSRLSRIGLESATRFLRAHQLSASTHGAIGNHFPCIIFSAVTLLDYPPYSPDANDLPIPPRKLRVTLVDQGSKAQVCLPKPFLPTNSSKTVIKYYLFAYIKCGKTASDAGVSSPVSLSDSCCTSVSVSRRSRRLPVNNTTQHGFVLPTEWLDLSRSHVLGSGVVVSLSTGSGSGLQGGQAIESVAHQPCPPLSDMIEAICVSQTLEPSATPPPIMTTTAPSIPSSTATTAVPSNLPVDRSPQGRKGAFKPSHIAANSMGTRAMITQPGRNHQGAKPKVKEQQSAQQSKNHLKNLLRDLDQSQRYRDATELAVHLRDCDIDYTRDTKPSPHTTTDRVPHDGFHHAHQSVSSFQQSTEPHPCSSRSTLVGGLSPARSPPRSPPSRPTPPPRLATTKPSRSHESSNTQMRSSQFNTQPSNPIISGSRKSSVVSSIPSPSSVSTSRIENDDHKSKLVVHMGNGVVLICSFLRRVSDLEMVTDEFCEYSKIKPIFKQGISKTLHHMEAKNIRQLDVDIVDMLE